MPRARKTLEQHALNGTVPDWAPLASTVVSTIAMSKPRMPEAIKADKEASADWREMVRTLKERGTLTRADGPLIELYCNHRKRWRMALAQLEDDGLVCEYERLDSNGTSRKVEKHNLYLKIAEVCERNMLAVLDRLGIGPVMKDKPRPGAAPKPKPAPAPVPTNEELGLSPDELEVLEKFKAEKEQEND